MTIKTGAQASPIRYERYAFRETAGGVLTGHFREPIAMGAGKAVAAVEPFLNRKGEFDKTPGFESAALLTAGAWLSRKTSRAPSYSISFEDRWTAAPGQVAAWAPEIDAPDAGMVAVTRVVSLTGEALNAWLHTPPERAATYLQWFAEVSADLQAALRRWMPYLLLREPVILNDQGLRDSLLFYAATKPYSARTRGAFTWDVICPDSMASVFRSGSQNLSTVLEKAQQYALAGGRPDLAETFAPSEMRRVMIQVRRDPRALKGLLTAEGKLVEALLALGGKGQELGAATDAPKSLHRFCGEWARGVQTKMRRILGPVASPHLVDLALVEGTAALARHAGLKADRQEWAEFKTVRDCVPPIEKDWPLAA